jgi:hypothetical protein
LTAMAASHARENATLTIKLPELAIMSGNTV